MRFILENKPFFPEEIYSEYLCFLQEIKFTRREIDVISCLVNARGTSKIASLLSISPKTIVTHIRNIMLKLECNSREGIIDFIERSHKLHILREYYSSLMTEIEFEKSLKEISKLKRDESPKFLPIYWENQGLKNMLIHHLNCHLERVGIKVGVQEYNSHQKIELTQSSDRCLILFLPKESKNEVLEELASFRSIDLSEHKNYYLAVFEIFKSFIPNNSIDVICLNFQNHSEGLRQASKNEKDKIEPKETRKKSDTIPSVSIFIKEKRQFIIVFCFVGLISIGALFFKVQNEFNQNISQTYSINQKINTDSPIRSDLVMPTESSFLPRPELIAQIDNKLNNQKGGIRTVALIGAGGAGKTTLSRQFAHGQRSSIIWEINAETQESIRSSFENLAQAFAKTEEDKNTLREIQDVKDIEKKESKVIQFIKKRLILRPHWFLIFDNVEKFSDIQKHFPQDCETWGQGKIILTTRNSNIENNKHINSIIQIGELTPNQKAKLFMNITNRDNEMSIPSSQIKEIKAFLRHIPSFPLDVSVAAYYLKTTHLPYAIYLENLSKYNKAFESLQENILKESGDYKKTRYGIISMSTRHLIETEKSFESLLLLISLLDSQNIPRNLLCDYKENGIIDKFIYSLKKYSFITWENQDSVLGFTFSLHRSTQAFILESLRKNLEKPLGNLLQSLSDALNAYIVKIIRNEDFPMMKAITFHCESFLSHKNLLSDSIQGTIGGRLGSIYYYQGNFLAAKEIIEKSLDHLKNIEKENYISIAFNFLYLGNVYRSLGDLEKARKFLTQSVMLYAKYGKNDEGFPKALGFLGFLCREAGSYKEAEHFLKQSLSHNVQNFSEHSIPAAWSSAHLAMTYREIGDYTKAQKLFEKSLLVYKKKGEDYVGVAWILAHLALVYKEAKDFRKAKELLNQSLTIYKKHFSDNHLYINQVFSYLGQVLVELGDYEKAKIILLNSLSFYEKNGGSVSNDVGRILIGLGKLYLIKRDLRKSSEFFKKALAIYKTRTHPDLYRALENLAELTLQDVELLKNKGQVQQANTLQKEAVDYLKQALQITKAHFTKDSPHFVRIKEKLKKIEKVADNCNIR